MSACVNDAVPRLVSATWGIFPCGFNFQRLTVTSSFTKRPNIDCSVVWPFQKKKKSHHFIPFESGRPTAPTSPQRGAETKTKKPLNGVHKNDEAEVIW